MESSEEKFENYFHFLSTRKNWDISKTKDSNLTASAGCPQMYAVYIINNNAPNDFIIELIKKFFHKSTGQAVKTALEIDKDGRALCEIYTRDAAETKVMQVLEYAQGQQQEVKCIMQKSDSHAVKKS
jgi:ATP-dependent Clp protease adaptor protein ClpS